MPTPGSITRRAAFAACLLLTIAARAHAQPLPSPSTAPPSADFMTHYDFQLSMAALSGGDQRFSWDAHFGGDVDLVDYVVGRANVLIDYEAVLGSEFRPFDPNQGNYTLEASGSARVAGPRSPACSITSRAISAIGRRRSRSRGTRSGCAPCGGWRSPAAPSTRRPA